MNPPVRSGARPPARRRLGPRARRRRRAAGPWPPHRPRRRPGCQAGVSSRDGRLPGHVALHEAQDLPALLVQAQEPGCAAPAGPLEEAEEFVHEPAAWPASHRVTGTDHGVDRTARQRVLAHFPILIRAEPGAKPYVSMNMQAGRVRTAPAPAGASRRLYLPTIV